MTIRSAFPEGVARLSFRLNLNILSPTRPFERRMQDLAVFAVSHEIALPTVTPMAVRKREGVENSKGMQCNKARRARRDLTEHLQACIDYHYTFYPTPDASETRAFCASDRPAVFNYIDSRPTSYIVNRTRLLLQSLSRTLTMPPRAPQPTPLRINHPQKKSSQSRLVRTLGTRPSD